MTRPDPELPDVDLDAEAVYLPDSTRLTSELAAEIVEDVRRQTKAGHRRSRAARRAAECLAARDDDDREGSG